MIKELLEQANKHIVVINRLSRELEDFEAVLYEAQSESSKVCFGTTGSGTTYISVLSQDRLQELKSIVLQDIIQAQEVKAAELRRLIGMDIIPEKEVIVPQAKSVVQENKPVTRKEEKPTPAISKAIAEFKPEMTVELVSRLYKDEGKSQGYIAEYCGVKKSLVNTFLQRNHLFRTSAKEDGFRDRAVEQKRRERP